MDAMPISKFKAQCLSVMDRVRRTGRPVRVTRYGRPMADVVPSTPAKRDIRTLGFLNNTTTVIGDLIAPVLASRDWNALK